MNPEFNFNSSSSSRHFLDLNEDYIPGCEQYYYGCLSSYTNNPAAAISQQHQDQPTASSTNYFNLSQDYQSTSRQPKVDDKKIAVVEGLSSSTGHLFSASSHQETNKDSSTEDHMKTIDHEKRSTSTNDHGSTKWMSSKMRAMRKMLRSSGTDHHLYIPAASNSDYNQINSDDNCNSSSTTAEVVRVCSDCKTTKTPLWRGGPQGPKSLCNACGIRRRKARKAMALAAAAQNDSDIVLKMDHCTSAGALKILNHKDKKSRKSHHDAKQSGLQTSAKTKLSFEEFATSFINRKSNEMFPQDEEEAAVLLMALSCGLIHH